MDAKDLVFGNFSADEVEILYKEGDKPIEFSKVSYSRHTSAHKSSVALSSSSSDSGVVTGVNSPEFHFTKDPDQFLDQVQFGTAMDSPVSSPSGSTTMDSSTTTTSTKGAANQSKLNVNAREFFPTNTTSSSQTTAPTTTPTTAPTVNTTSSTTTSSSSSSNSKNYNNNYNSNNYSGGYGPPPTFYPFPPPLPHFPPYPMFPNFAPYPFVPPTWFQDMRYPYPVNPVRQNQPNYGGAGPQIAVVQPYRAKDLHSGIQMSEEKGGKGSDHDIKERIVLDVTHDALEGIKPLPPRHTIKKTKIEGTSKVLDKKNALSLKKTTPTTTEDKVTQTKNTTKKIKTTKKGESTSSSSEQDSDADSGATPKESPVATTTTGSSNTPVTSGDEEIACKSDDGTVMSDRGENDEASERGSPKTAARSPTPTTSSPTTLSHDQSHKSSQESHDQSHDEPHNQVPLQDTPTADSNNEPGPDCTSSAVATMSQVITTSADVSNVTPPNSCDETSEPSKSQPGPVRPVSKAPGSWAAVVSKAPPPSAQPSAPAPPPKTEVKPPVRYVKGPVNVGNTSNNGSNTTPYIENPEMKEQARLSSKALGEQMADIEITYDPVSVVPRGLANNGNLCYINATLQALLCCPALCHLLDSLCVKRRRTYTSSTITTDSMAAFITNFDFYNKEDDNLRATRRKRARGSGGREVVIDEPFSPDMVYDILPKIKSHLSVGGRQEDAEEFLCCLLNKLHDEMVAGKETLEAALNEEEEERRKSLAKEEEDEEEEDTNDDDDDDGEEWQEVGPRNKSTITRRTTYTESPISIIFGGKLQSSLYRYNMKESATVQPFFSLQLDIQPDCVRSVKDALELLSSRESINLSDKEDVGATRRITLVRLPPILILHLKRFLFLGTSSHKLMKTVTYELDLEVPKELLAPSVKSKVTPLQRMYRLCAVVYHHGKTPHGGHYTCDVFQPPIKSWLRFDDAYIRPITCSQLFQNPQTPYLLFYQQFDTHGYKHPLSAPLY